MTDLPDSADLHSRSSWLRGASWLVGATVLNGVVSAAVGLTLVRTFGPRNLGLYSLATACAGLAGVFATFRMDAHLLTRFDRTDRDRVTYATVLRAAYLLYAPVALIVVVSAIVFTSGRTQVVTLLAVAEVAVMPLGFARVRLQICMRQKAIFVCTALGRLAWMAAVGALVFFEQATVSSVITMRIGSALLEALLLHRLAALPLLRSLCTRPPRGAVHATIRDSAPLAVAGLTGEAYTRLDQPLIGALRGAREVGLYSAGVRLVDLTGVHAPIIQSVVAPGLVDLHRRGDRAGTERAIRDGLLLTLVPGGLLIAAAITQAEWLALHLLGASYARSAPIIQALALAEWVTFVGTAYATALIAEERRAVLLWANVAGLATNMAINLAFVRRFGGIAAAWASVIGYAVAAVAMMAGSPALRLQFLKTIGLLGKCGAALAVGIAVGEVAEGSAAAQIFWSGAAQLGALVLLLPKDLGRVLRRVRALSESNAH